MGLTAEQEKLVQKRVDDDTCALCRRKFEPGHRVVPTYIVYDPSARNPNLITERGLRLGNDYEWTHASCEDPFCDGRRIVTL